MQLSVVHECSADQAILLVLVGVSLSIGLSDWTDDVLLLGVPALIDERNSSAVQCGGQVKALSNVHWGLCNGHPRSEK